jgi:hypothetical protein
VAEMNPSVNPHDFDDVVELIELRFFIDDYIYFCPN